MTTVTEYFTSDRYYSQVGGGQIISEPISSSGQLKRKCGYNSTLLGGCLSIHRLELADHHSLELYFRRDSSVRQLWNEVAEIHQVATYTPGGESVFQ